MSEQILFGDFQKVNICVGKILSAEDSPKAKKRAYKLIIDFGKEIGIKNSSAQITKLYSKDELIGMQIIAVVNFPPKRVADFISEVLVLGVETRDGEVALLRPEREVEIGMRIS